MNVREASRTWRLNIGVGELHEVLLSNEPVPKRGAAIKPDWRGRTMLYNDGQLLGALLLEVDCVDYTRPSGRVAWLELQYDPTVREAA